MKTAQEVFQETVAAMNIEEKRAIFPPKVMKNFVVRKSWVGRGQLITFTNKKGKTITYDHDIALEIMRPRLELMNTNKEMAAKNLAIKKLEKNNYNFIAYCP